MNLIKKVVNGRSTTQKPIWLMRQAGRYLPEFRKIRKENSDFIKLCLNEILVPEITLQPLKRFNIDAAIIGMLHSKQVIQAVIRSINKIKIKKVVLDPVMVAKGGAKLINNQAISYIKNKFIKKIFLITPNIPEAEILTNSKITCTNDMIQAGKILINLGAKNVLIKGGHLNSRQMSDILLNKKNIKVFRSKKHRSKNTHGTGCTLSSAIATYLSCGKDLNKSCELGIKYVNEAIKSNLNLGKGNGPINHLNSFNINKKFK